jgi:group II intron reverse transcriptase/maturase/CRISPR-associated endonuclease Cas1
VFEQLSFDRYLIRLRFTAEARFPHFLHGGVVHGLLCSLFEHRTISDGVIPSVPESGRTRYRSGEPYHFGVTLVGDDRKSLQTIEKRLPKIGASGVVAGSVVLGGNFEVEAVESLPAVDLEAEALALGGDAFELLFVSPLRLDRPAENVAAGAAFVDRKYFSLDHFLDRLWRRLFRLRHGRWPSQEERTQSIPRLPGTAVADPSRMLWIELPTPQRKRTLGGCLGRVEAEGIPEEWRRPLVLGRHLHAGSAIHFGFGSYVLGTNLGTKPGTLETPARSIYQCLAERERLERALDHIADQSVAGGVDGVSPARFRDEREQRLSALLGAVEANRVTASPLLGIPTRRDERRKIRPLAIPTVGDRVLQRAAIEVLGPAVDTLFEDCSFAYRKGYSRAGAARAIQQAYRDGFRMVLDADITAFFEEVRWDRLFDMIAALFPGEPLNELLRAWVKAPVHFEGLRLSRSSGLPQGAPISPLLANLYLDELDDEVLGEEFRLVRFADDFVVLCRDLDAAQQARATVESALAELGLRLNEGETAFRSLDDGMSYLGYLFCRNLVLEPLREQGHEAISIPAATSLQVPARSWLAQVPLDRVRAVLDRHAGRDQRIEAIPIGEGRLERRALYVVSPQARLHLREGTLVVDDGSADKYSVPVRQLSHVVFLGRSRVTIPLLLSLDAHGVPSYFCQPTGTLRARWEPHAPDWPLWLKQARCLEAPGLRLTFAREIVEAKLRNQATLLVRHDLDVDESAPQRIRTLAEGAAIAGSLDEVRGFEGAGAKEFFAALRAKLGPDWGFLRRQHRPPPDPINALLSFLYSMLHHHVSTAVITAGFNPRLGLFHESRGAHHALASDLQEEFRFLSESTLLSLVRRREIGMDDFRLQPGARYPVLLKTEPRKQVITAFEHRILGEVCLDEDRSERPWREHIDRQAKRLRQWIADPSAEMYRSIRAPG